MESKITFGVEENAPDDKIEYRFDVAIYSHKKDYGDRFAEKFLSLVEKDETIIASPFYTNEPNPEVPVKSSTKYKLTPVSDGKDAYTIVNDNFKGLWNLIDDENLSWFYRELIVTCMEEWRKMTIPK